MTFCQHAAPAKGISIAVVNQPAHLNAGCGCDAKAQLLDTQISDYRLGPTFAADIRALAGGYAAP